MFNSLRWKVVAAFIALILLTTLISTMLSLWFTSNGFALYVTAQQQQDAQKLATQLSTVYALQGGWNNLARQSTETTPFVPSQTREPRANWTAELQGVLQLNDEAVEAVQNGSSSWAAEAEQRNIRAEVLVRRIWEAERPFIEAEILSGELIAYEYAMFKWEVEALAWQVVGGRATSTSQKSWLIDVLRESKGHVLVTNGNGRVLYDSQAQQLEGQLLGSELLSQGALIWDYSQQPAIQVGTVIMASDSSGYDAQQRLFALAIRRSLLLSALIAGGTALLLAFWLSERLVKPITVLTTATQQLAAGELDQPLPATGRDELGKLSRTFNQMAHELATQRMLRRQLINDVVHDLKTPLSIINLEIEAAELDMQSPEAALEPVKSELSLLETLINDLSWLAKSDKGELLLNPKPHDLGVLTAQNVARWQSQAEAANLRLTFQKEDVQFIANIDQARYTQVLNNLLGNAVNYTPSGGEILVNIVRQPRPTRPGMPCAVTTVRNNGPGISPADLPHIFERFYRTDKSRNRAESGRGLGLAIVRTIVELHGGWTWAESTPHQWTTIGIGIPLYLEKLQEQEEQVQS